MMCTRALPTCEATCTASRALSTSALRFAVEQETHTGQKWSEEDMRQMRFGYGSGGGAQDVDAKEVNPHWAIDWVKKTPIIEVVGKRVVACDGGGNPALGHPKVYINLDTHEPVSCIYCGLRYQLKADH